VIDYYYSFEESEASITYRASNFMHEGFITIVKVGFVLRTRFCPGEFETNQLLPPWIYLEWMPIQPPVAF
jgi:aminoglycoside phosphotransferase family enzyme